MTLLIGIMADSHGRPEMIRDALAALKGLSCRAVYHLGDVCDSAHPETAEACLGLLHEQHVMMIKGNNDYAIIAGHIDRPTPFADREVWEYLQAAPLIRYYQNAVFTHSLPFAATMGLACMIGTMGTRAARQTFAKFSRHIIFRGHSHTPEIVRPHAASVSSRRLESGETIDLAGKIPCVVTIGALTRGLYMVWNPAENSIICLSLA